ncbi:hypothetical protein PENTCL1PPCAC_779, partial [Pristionchus entomophagus]
SDRTVLHILKLADRFEMKVVMNQAEKFLIRSTGIKNKLSIADQYRLTALRGHCLLSYTTPQDLLKLKSEVKHFSDETKLAICDRLYKM